jgi:pimeloyl-ACP methyl ester carboxylesterase
MLASNGYIVLIPDYIGFGASENFIHPYYHRSSSNNAVIDLIHAFDEMKLRDNVLATSSATTYLIGYSQGGWATLSALDEIENGPATGIEVAAASCGAGAYDLIAMSNYILDLETFPGPHYLPYFIYSQQVMGLILEPLSTFFKSPYTERIPELFNGNYSNSEVNAQLTNTIGDLLTDNLINNFQTGQEFDGLRERLIENSIDAWNTNTALHFYHGTDDSNVPPEQSSLIYDAFINAGSDPGKVSLFELAGMDHDDGVLPWGISTISWFNTLEGK